MNAFSQLLDKRDERAKDAADQRRRDGEVSTWLAGGKAPEARLLAFDKWVNEQLAKRLDWTWAGDAKAKRIEQCRVYLERLVLELWRRGWMLDGKRLAAHIEKMLDAVGSYQRAGKVANFWAYFQAAVDRYVGGNAEEIRDEAMRVGAHAGQVLKALGVERRAGPALPELIAQRAAEIATAKDESLRAKQARLRAKDAACSDAASQWQLFDNGSGDS